TMTARMDFAADIISTHISMEMLAATVLEEPEPEPEPAPPVVEPELPKEEVADPTVKPEPPKEPEKPKEPESQKRNRRKNQKKSRKNRRKNNVIYQSQIAKLILIHRSINKRPQQVTSQPIIRIWSVKVIAQMKSMLIARLYAEKLKNIKRYPNRARMMRKQGVVTIT
ncbi:hypothetical protein AAUPMB_12341, partial [Pasteurella multocida subsp. multocida str. Anand1_buffalo]